MTTQRKWQRAASPKLNRHDVKVIVRHRDGYRCTKCGMTARQHVREFGKTLDVHRLVPGSPYTVKGCVTLCRTCHGPQAKSPIGTSEAGDGHKSTFMVRLPEIYRTQLLLWTQRTGRSITKEVLIAVEEHLAREEGQWPANRNPQAK